MQIAFLLYEGFTMLDLIGPYEVLCRLPDAEVRFVAKKPGEIRPDTKAVGLVADHGLTDVPSPQILVVPGGSAGTIRAAQDEEIISWVRGAHAHSDWTTSVCTGSLILGAAGLLEGLKATTHWAARALLEETGAHYSEQRVVRQGRILTAAGVSSGIDMALVLAAEIGGPELAQVLQLAIEYDPQPPFDAGSPAKAGDAVMARALQELASGMTE